jgi:peptide-methionine (S)-S-oxide reductase
VDDAGAAPISLISGQRTALPCNNKAAAETVHQQPGESEGDHKRQGQTMLFRHRNTGSSSSIGSAAPATAPPFTGDGPHGAERATFAAGCFWGVEAAFREIEGVVQTSVGYTGGHTRQPTYEQVCSHVSGHAEAVEVWFDPARVSYEQLLDSFWKIHNPTTRNRQGLDIGSQYRSAIFFHSPEQEAAASSSRDREQAKQRRRIVTEIVPASAFYRAEEYHQRYFEKTGRAACAVTLS